MSKKTIKTLIIILSIIIIGLFIGAYFVSRDESGSGVVSDNTKGDFFGNFFFNDESGGGGSGGGGTGGSFGGSSGGSLFEDGRDGLNNSGGEKKIPVLRQITSLPVAGAVIFEKGKEILIRYMDRSTGHVYEINAKETSPNRLTNTTIPRVHETLFANDGKSLVARYLDEETDVIKSFGGTINEETSELEGTFFVDNIEQVAVSEGSDRIFYLFASEDSETVGTASDFDGKNKSQLFDSPFSEWLVSWPRVRNITFNTKPSAEVLGYMYFLNTQNGAFDKILGDINGLTTLTSFDATKVLYNESFSRSKTFDLNLYDVVKDEITKVGVSTLPEKCAWSSDSDVLYCGVPTSIPRAEYPDEWYQGIVSFSDDIWKIDTENGFVDLLVIPKEVAGVEIDLINPNLSENEDYLLFTNKKDSTLWSLSL